ncbi:ribonuclease H-like domain-containing protein [Tanacetum coccineum]
MRGEFDKPCSTHPLCPNWNSVIRFFAVPKPLITEWGVMDTNGFTLYQLLIVDAFSDPNWQNVMRDEFHALIHNQTWTLVPRPPDTNIVCCMWLFRHKYLADGTLSPVVKPGTIQTVLSLAASRHWPIHQLDVKNAFLHGDLSETVYMHQPLEFLFILIMCVYYRGLTMGLNKPSELGFSGTNTAYLLLYVDDIVLTVSSESLLQQIIRSLHQEFDVTDLGPFNYFLNRAHMVNCNHIRTPIDTESKLGSNGDMVADPTLYRSLAGSLHYLTFTRPDISYAVHQVCLYMHDPREPYFSALKRILRYVRGTLDYRLQLFSLSTTDLVAYSHADWPTLSRSSAEADCSGVANTVAETCWLRNLLHELQTPLFSATLVYCDNVNAVYLSFNPVQYQRTKHIEIDIYFVRDSVADGQVRVLHVPSRYQYADISPKDCLQLYLKNFAPV